MPLPPLTHTTPRPAGYEPTAQRPLRLVARNLAAGQTLPPHSHPWGQLTYAAAGMVRVRAARRSWVVPPQRAIWIPPDLVHDVVTLETTQLRVLYLDPASTPDPFQDQAAPQCQVLDVAPLLRELIVALAVCDDGSPRETLLRQLILNELALAHTLPICVPLPSDKRLHKLCQLLLNDPAASQTLEQWAPQVGASARTLARLFERELDMSFSAWRQQMRLAHAAALIARGLPLARVAAELGYASQSAFSAMFKKTFGQSPSVFFTLRSK